MDNGLLQLALGSVPAIVLVFLIVEGLKRYGFVDYDDSAWFTAPRAGLTAGLVLAVIALVAAFVPAAAPVIEIAAPIVVGGLVAGLFYDLAGARLLARVQAVIDALLGSTGE